MGDRWTEKARAIVTGEGAAVDGALPDLEARIASALRAAHGEAMEEAARACDEKHAACVERQIAMAQAGDTRNEEWYRAKANAAEALARDIRSLAAPERT